MKLLCPITTIISPEEFCQINCISRNQYESDRILGKIFRNGPGGALVGDDARFHNTFDVLHYALTIAMQTQKLLDSLENPYDTCEEILDRIASIIESFETARNCTQMTLVEGCLSDPILFALNGKANEAFCVYRKIGDTLVRTESVLDGSFFFKLGMSNSLNEESGKWASNVWINHCNEHFHPLL